MQDVQGTRKPYQFLGLVLRIKLNLCEHVLMKKSTMCEKVCEHFIVIRVVVKCKCGQSISDILMTESYSNGYLD